LLPNIYLAVAAHTREQHRPMRWAKSVREQEPNIEVPRQLFEPLILGVGNIWRL
jgi:hypothetical protein